MIIIFPPKTDPVHVHERHDCTRLREVAARGCEAADVHDLGGREDLCVFGLASSNEEQRAGLKKKLFNNAPYTMFSTQNWGINQGYLTRLG